MEFKYIRLHGHEVAFIGDSSSQKVILVIGQSNSYKHSAPLNELLSRLSIKNYLIIWAHWPKHESELSTDNQIQVCGDILQALGESRSVTILSHSAGGRIAAHLHSQMNLDRIICFGYPFRHSNGPRI